MNTIKILTTPEPIEVNYTSMLDIQLAIGKAGLGNISDAKAMDANRSIYIEIPEGMPKNKLSELDTIVKTFNFGGIVTNEVEEWEKGGFGSKVNWDSDEPLIHRGVDVNNPEKVAKVRKVIKKFQDAAEEWKALKNAGIVRVDGNFHIKTLPEYRKTRKKTS